ncbi:type II toxin-antitoxin system RelE/ParE family toxin [Salinisphaera japonica]|uniref:Plasmid stabilization protein n=1 Tax=Salinisphaera japonica YTM-1 TaxID=1209778 RepID=A0A423PZB2_9GAMM|nr:type II toxin-antitoxin system RelE/ParE family toxin [Salinisphaera japonica]ROO30967.1 plasmid stabilization protein [Salinisphaera japonica YTM-1]
MTVEFHPEADDEFIAQIGFYESQRSGLGDAFVNAVYQTLERLLAFPELGKPAGQRTRRLLVQRFPHSVIYQYKNDRLFVLAIAHDKRQSGYWRDRT